MTDEERWEFLRRYLHDMRNHLNGVEMEALLLDSLLPGGDGEPQEAVGRIRAELVSMERALGSLTTRFAPLKRGVVSAMDVHTRWQSRGRDAAGSSCVWRCELADELIDVDMKIVVEALCEVLVGGAVEAVATASDGGVLYQVKNSSSSSPGASLPNVPLLGFEDAIARNGGRYQSRRDEGSGEQVSGCWFPCASAPGV